MSQVNYTRTIGLVAGSLLAVFGARFVLDGAGVDASLGLRRDPPLRGVTADDGAAAAWRIMAGIRNLAFGAALTLASYRGDLGAAGYLLAATTAMEAAGFATMAAYAGSPMKPTVAGIPLVAALCAVGAWYAPW